MTSNWEIVQEFAQRAGQLNAPLPRNRSRNIYVSSSLRPTLVSYGEHFPLASIMPGEHSERAWWLLNGDQYSVSTTRHQALTRRACEQTGLPMLIVPFTCLADAGIQRNSIVPVDLEADGYTEIRHHAYSLDDIPATRRSDAVPAPGGGWRWTSYRHWLGASVFQAAYSYYCDDGHLNTGEAYFLSAFDVQEPNRHYFLCQLPDDAEPTSVAEAFESLKPPEVVAAEAAGLICTRQGDVFAIPTDVTTRQLSGKRTRMTHVLGLNHAATEVCVADDGTTYARGILWHRPFEPWRSPEHVRQPMGDRKTWHVLVKNTVPVDADGKSRAWSRTGDVD